MSEELGCDEDYAILPPPGPERLAALVADNAWRIETGNDEWLWCVDSEHCDPQLPHRDHSIGRRRANRRLKKKRGAGRFSSA